MRYSSLTRRVTKKAQLQNSRVGLPKKRNFKTHASGSPKTATSKRVSEGSPINSSLTRRVTKSSLLNKALTQVQTGKAVAACLVIHVNNPGFGSRLVVVLMKT